MNIGEILQTKRWKVFTGYVYNLGASVVLLGALFKLQHWPNAGLFLMVGLITEAFIFFISAFEPPMELPDWGKVYPELREGYELDEEYELRKEEQGSKLDKLFESTNITPELLNKVSKGLTDLGNTASSISDITTATLATDIYVRNLNTAAESMVAFSEINNRANEEINNSVGNLVSSYSTTAQQISETGAEIFSNLNETSKKFTEQISTSGNKLVESYERLSGSINAGFSDLDTNSKVYGENLRKLNKNIETLSQTYETQLKGTTEQMQASQKFFADLNQMNSVIAQSIEEIKKYKQNAELLNSHLESLNSIYGNMLGAMNYKKK
ncbi:MAG: gliding motility protein GldL [Prolixibacteraceae bacterium]|jgi:gliding motility-associated protein GldL|nr:gliding motility protein GldL [Prolixibacteraceae bacterium]